MNEVKLKDFIQYLEPDIDYGFRSDVGKNGIEIYLLAKFCIDEPIATLPYSHEEWSRFLAKHHCNMDGDYKTPRYSSRRNYHLENEDGISFLIACGKDVLENCNCDWLIIESPSQEDS